MLGITQVQPTPNASDKVQPMPKPLRLLVVDGYKRDVREDHRASYGLTPSGSYAETVAGLAAGATVDICFPADEGANLPDGQGLASYDGVFLTGSSLHIYHDDPAITRQIELMRSIYASGTPCFGSCWGIQMGAVAAGGSVIRNPLGREVGFARRIAPTEAGRSHPLLAGRPLAFDAPAIHLDVIAQLPADALTLASNSTTGVQAAEITHEGGTLWGVQYHPEFSLEEIAAIFGRVGSLVLEEGFLRNDADLQSFIADMRALHAEPERLDLAWRHGLDAQVLDSALRLTEIRNFLEFRVKPTVSARGRA